MNIRCPTPIPCSSSGCFNTDAPQQVGRQGGGRRAAPSRPSEVEDESNIARPAFMTLRPARPFSQRDTGPRRQQDPPEGLFQGWVVAGRVTPCAPSWQNKTRRPNTLVSRTIRRCDEPERVGWQAAARRGLHALPTADWPWHRVGRARHSVRAAPATRMSKYSPDVAFPTRCRSRCPRDQKRRKTLCFSNLHGKRCPFANRAPHPFRPAGRRTVWASGPCHPCLQTGDNANS